MKKVFLLSILISAITSNAQEMSASEKARLLLSAHSNATEISNLNYNIMQKGVGVACLDQLNISTTLNEKLPDLLSDGLKLINTFSAGNKVCFIFKK